MVNLSTLLKITPHFVKPLLSTASDVKLSGKLYRTDLFCLVSLGKVMLIQVSVDGYTFLSVVLLRKCETLMPQ